MASSLSQLSASVTRILSLTGFPKELKTRDIHAAFAEWETVNGGFKIKWIDDTSALIVFQDATVAKRAYLQILANPPATFSSPTTESSAVIRPYDGPDAQNIIQNVNSRGQNPTRGHNARAASVALPPQRSRSNGSVSAVQVNGLGGEPHPNGLVAGPVSPIGREGSPALPTLPSHPTLDSLINSSLADGAGPPAGDPAILAMSPPVPHVGQAVAGPRIGDPGKRMLGAALGVRHPGLGPRQVGAGAGAEQALKEMQRAMGGLAVAE
ncbi:hypothetical protein FA95DRAFT_1609304 [Auriscalpium vulgare]|uniref:Uncharacterized protein n=1 Tax=Auriscalpium vulgare TaxID=40419 RepID=A0ACB8RID0_9AGAM|nr:hypothetical protein FA95DRAFT_1609304 [Auriscalpium vulgare]